MFQTVKSLSAYPTYLHFGLFCKFFGEFWECWGINSFSHKISKIDGNRKFGRFGVVSKLEFEGKNC